MTTSNTPSESNQSRTLLSTLGTLTRRVLVVLIALVITLYAAIWLLSPWVIKQQLETPLSELGYQLGDTSHFRFNPFTFTLSIEELALLKNLSEEKSRATVLSIQKALVSLGFFDIFNKNIVIDDFELRQTKLLVQRTDSVLSVAGYDLSEPDPSSAPRPADKPDTNDEQTLDLKDWHLVLNAFSIDEFDLELTNNGHKHLLTLETLSLENMNLGLGDQAGAMGLSASINDTSLSGLLSFELEQQNGSVELDLTIQNFALAPFTYLLPPDIQNVSGTLSLEIQQQLQLSNKGIALTLENLSIKADQLSAEIAELTHKLAQGNLTLTNSEVKLDQAGEIDLKLEPSLAIQNIEIRQSEDQQKLLSVGQIGTQGLTLKQATGNNLEALLSSFQVRNIVVSEASDKPAIFSGEGLDITDISFVLAPEGSSSRTTINEFELKPFQSAIFIAQDGTLDNLVLPQKRAQDEDLNAVETSESAQEATLEQVQSLADGASDDETADVASSGAQLAPHSLALKRFYVSGPSKVDFLDQSVIPFFSQGFQITQLEVNDIDSSAPESPSPFTFEFSSGDYTQGSLTGQAKPFTEKVNLELATTLKEFSLPKVSPYVRGPAGFDLLAGQFDLNTTLKIVEDELDGETELFLRGLELESAKDVKRGELSEHSFIPLNLALSALKDSDGNIELDVGLSGNVHGPKFGLEGFIYLIAQKAILSAAESYAINTFVPYANIVSLARTAGSFALKVRIDDLIYRPQQITEYSEEQLAFIDDLVSLYQQKPELQLKLCAISTFDEIPEEDKDKSPELQTQALISLAEERAAALKSLLFKEHDVAASRIILCKGRVDGSDEAQPRIEFSI